MECDGMSSAGKQLTPDMSQHCLLDPIVWAVENDRVLSA
jgi:hypothetical protein